VVETDIANCFSAIPHEKLVQAVEERICDQSLLRLLRGILRAGAMEEGQVRRMEIGTPQGGLCAAAHKDPYEQRWLMRSARRLPLVGAVVTAGRCA
jgi:RNA-directed DNA polymerase